MSFKPLLAPGEDPKKFPDYFKKLQYPLLASPKYDGIRCIIKSNAAMSRTFKMLPSYQVQEMFGRLSHLDGEIIEGNPTDFDVYNRTQSHVMSEDKPGDIKFYVFDYSHPDWLARSYYERLDRAREIVNALDETVELIEHQYIENYDELIAYENAVLEQGFEGIMMRNPVAHYKQGRATFREGIIYKLKRFQDDEGVIIGFEEQMTNTNDLETDELGYAKRSYKKEGMVSAGTLGKFIILYGDQEITVAPGQFTHEQRKEIWENQGKYIHRLLKFRFFAHGVKDKPRFPRAIGFRDRMDV